MRKNLKVKGGLWKKNGFERNDVSNKADGSKGQSGESKSDELSLKDQRS